MARSGIKRALTDAVIEDMGAEVVGVVGGLAR